MIKNATMRRLVLASTAALFFFAAVPLLSHAQTDEDGGAFEVGPRLTLSIGDISDNFDGTVALGADARYHFAEFPVSASGAFDFYFADDNVTVYTLDFNALYRIETDASFSPYAGAGLGFTDVSVDTETQFGSFGGSDTGLNLVGGAKFEAGSLKPFAQAQITLGDLTRIGITGGLLFSL